MATVTITAPTVRAKTSSVPYHRIMQRRDTIRQDAVTALATYGAQVNAELDAIATLPHDVRATRAASFAILSPQADFDDNVRAVPVLLDCLRNHATPLRIVDALRDVGYKMTYEQKASQYIASRDLILDARPQDVTLTHVTSHLGFAEKTGSMFCALYNQWSPVITLDTWMLSGLLGVANTGGKKNANTYTASGQGYHDIAGMLLDMAEELNVSPFLLQWSLWCHYRGFFSSHLPIFGI
jgi:hypothetical protein